MFRHNVSASQKNGYEDKTSSRTQKITSLYMRIKKNERNILGQLALLQEQKQIDAATISTLSSDIKQAFVELDQKIKLGENGFQSILADLEKIIVKSGEKLEADVLIELGSRSCLDKKYEESTKHFNKALLLLLPEKAQNLQAIADVLQHLGMCHLKLNNMRSAIVPLTDAYTYYKNKNMNAAACTGLMLGLTYYYLKDNQNADLFFGEAISFLSSLKEAEHIEKALQVIRYIMQDQITSLKQSQILTTNLEKLIQITTAFNELNPPKPNYRFTNSKSIKFTKKAAEKLFKCLSLLAEDVFSLMEIKKTVIFWPYESHVISSSKPSTLFNKTKSLFTIPSTKEDKREERRPASR